MAKKKSTKINYTREMYIKAYLKIKGNKHNYEVNLQVFNKNSNLPQNRLYTLFKDYKELKTLSEEEYVRKLPESQRALLSENNKKFNKDATKDSCIEDLRLVQKIEPLKHVSRTFYRNHGRYSDSTWSQFFGTFQEFRRQAGLELSRHQQALEKAIAKHAAHDHYEEYFIKNVLPYHNKYKKPNTPSKIKTLMVISDIHDLEADMFTINVFVDTCKRKQPDVIILNGDIYDLYEFSRFTKDPRNFDILRRFAWVQEFFGRLRKACPNAQIDLIMGNHEFRLLALLANETPAIRVLLSDIMGIGFEEIFQLDKYQINWVSKVNLRAFTKNNIDEEIRKNFQIYYGCYVAAHIPDKNLMNMSGTNGHHHKVEMHSTAFVDPLNNVGKQVTWVQTPSAHVSDAEYLDNLSKWNTGFLEVTINVELQEVIQKPIQTHSWCVVDGIMYERREGEEN